MSDIAISAENLGKQYKLYRTRGEKFLDTFGLARFMRSQPQEFWALRNVNLQVKRGERVGFIGRNGAGKSTLLKCFLGNITPTEGSVAVNGNVQALMELGTGFHPEFTGYENINAYLSYQGLNNRQIAEKVDEIVDFAELGDFINQPIKTYSAGMYARLAFSAATAIVPEILIIDEVLGAGDAYFAEKSTGRMKELATRHGATVLFVSHDMSSVEMLCDRAVWIERGEVVMDGETIGVSRAYAKVVRERTEQRLRVKNHLATQKQTGLAGDEALPPQLQLCLRMRSAAAGGFVGKVSLQNYDVERTLHIGATQDNMSSYDMYVPIDNQNNQVWSSPTVHKGVDCREMAKENGDQWSYLIINTPGFELAYKADLAVQYSAAEAVTVQAFNGEEYSTLGTLPATGGAWEQWPFTLEDAFLRKLMETEGFSTEGGETPAPEPQTGVDDVDDGPPQDLENDNSLAQKVLRITRVRFTDEVGREKNTFQSYDTMRIDIEYEALAEAEVEFAISIYRSGVTAQQYLSCFENGRSYHIQPGEKRRVRLEVPQLCLGRGRYFISVGAFPPFNLKNPDADNASYYLLDRKFEISVTQPEDTVLDMGICRNPYAWSDMVFDK